jgi:Bacterial Ig-like domain (group 3)/Putative Ig domain
MHNVISAVSRRKAGLAASVVLVGGMAGGVLFTSGTAFAASTTPTTTALSASVSSGTIDVNVTVTPTSSAAMSPTGNVRVSDGMPGGGCSLSLGQGGAGSCSISGLGPGTYNLQARYFGDANFTGSNSNGAKATISGPSTSKPSFAAGNPATSVNAGDNYSYNFNASGNPAPTYTLSGGNGWLSINHWTGVVSGNIPSSATGSFTYSVEASNSAGNAWAGPFTVQVRHHGFPGGNGNGGRLATSLNCSTPVRSGARGTCTLDVTNIGSGNAQNVSGDVSFPAQLTADFCGHGWGWGWFNSWGCNISGNTASENLGTLRPGQSRSVTVTFTARSTFWLWGRGHQFREWVRVDGSAQSQGNWQGWNWFGGSSSYSHAYVQILPPRFWW